jgi:hypothetical protein
MKARSIIQGVAVVLLMGARVPGQGAGGVQSEFTSKALAERVPVARTSEYILNAKVRPLLLFWIERDNVGDASLTWRRGADGRQAFEFLVGSDPARAPRRINRWGYIVEELAGDRVEILGVMSDASEQTIEEAKAKTATHSDVSTFKASRTTVAGRRAVNGVVTLQAPARLTYRDLESLLALIPGSSSVVRHVEVPPGTRPGFLVAMDSLMSAAAGPCRASKGGRPVGLSPVRYLYNQTLYDLSIESCSHQASVKTRTDTFADLVDGRFQITNTTTKHETDFRILYGASSDLKGVPVRAVFRPRWWMEVELVLQRPGAPAAAHVERR